MHTGRETSFGKVADTLALRPPETEFKRGLRQLGARDVVVILRAVFLAGDIWSVILPNSLARALMAALCVGATRRLTGKRLE